MKKKIIYGLLLVVAMVTASSSFVSCKDYEGDDYASLQDAIAKNGNYDKLSLQQIIKLQIKRLRYELNNALGNSNGGNYSDADINKWLNQLNGIESNYQNASSISDLIEVLSSLNQLASEAAIVNESLKNIRYAWSDSLKKAYDTAFVAYWLAYRDSARIDSLNHRVDSLHQNALDSARHYYDLAQKYAKKQDSIVLDSLNKVADRIYMRIQEHSDSLKQLEQALKDSSNNIRTDFTKALNDSCKDIRLWVEELLTGHGTIRVPKTDDQGNPMYDKDGNPVYEEKEIDVTNMQELLDALSDAVLSAQGISEQLKEDFEEALQKAKEDLQNEFNTSLNNAKIDLQNMFNEAVGQLQNQLDDLVKRVTELEKNVDKLKNTLAKQITGVVIQGAYSPILGNGSLPLGIQTNLLAAYASKATDYVDFPSTLDQFYADGTTVLTDADKTYLKNSNFWPAEISLAKGDYVISDREDNAGKLYLTVNPTNIDFEGTEFALVNSKGQESRMQLTPLKASEEVLNFGWTRTVGIENASANGFYEVNAKVTKENIEKMQANINTEMFKKAFKEQLNSKGTGLVSYAAAMDLARAVYSSLEPLQRFGVRATWQDATVASGERSYTSAFDIAATVIKPLGFGFTIPENKYTRFPVFDTEYLKNKFHIKGDFSLDVITDKATSEKKIWLIVEASWIEGLIFNSNYVTLSDDESYMFIKDGSLIKLDVTPLYNEIYGDLAASLTPYQDVIRQANDRIDYLVSYIDRYNAYATKANKWISNANNLLQPVILWCDGQNVGQLGGMISGNYAVGTVVPVGGAVALVPTSYTLELLAPAYKKSVVVTNVYKDGKSAQSGDSDLDAAAKAINAALKEGKFDLYEGYSLKNAFVFNADSKYEGMTFEFAYTALDYTGQIAGRKFYLTVK